MATTQRVHHGFPVVVTESSEVDITEQEYLDTALPGTIVNSKAAIYSSAGLLPVKRKVFSGVGATLAPTVNDSGALIVLDRAAGCVVTLPLASAGLWFDFLVQVTVTSNVYKVITGAATEFILGQLLSIDTDSSNVLAWTHVGNGSSHIAINMDSAGSNAKGGMIYTKFRLVCVSATLWVVDGINMGAGTVASPFSTT